MRRHRPLPCVKVNKNFTQVQKPFGSTDRSGGLAERPLILTQPRDKTLMDGIGINYLDRALYENGRES